MKNTVLKVFNILNGKHNHRHSIMTPEEYDMSMFRNEDYSNFISEIHSDITMKKDFIR